MCDDASPDVPFGGILLVADRTEPGPMTQGIVWLRAVALDRSVPYRGIAVFPEIVGAHDAAARLGGVVSFYTPITETFAAARSG